MKNFAFGCPEWLEETASTNDELRARLNAGAALSGQVLAARRQTRGRGRRGNLWRSSPGLDLTFSFVWRGDAPPSRLGTLPMACALGLCDFTAGSGAGACCRWPNDAVSAAGEKFGGVLAEGWSDSSGSVLVLGVGVNLARDPERDAGLERPTASLEQLLGRRLGQEEALAGLLPHLARRIAAWESRGFAGIREDLEARLWGRGRPASARTDAGPVFGRVAGLGENGELVLETPGGRTMVASAAALDWGFPAS